MQGVRFDSKPSQDGEKDKKRKKREKKKFVFGAGFEPTTLRLQILQAKIAKCNNSGKI